MTGRHVCTWCEHLVVGVVAFFLLLGMAEEANRRTKEGRR